MYTNPYNNYNNYNNYSNSPITIQTNKIYVSCYEDVVKYPMPTNCDMLFINKNEPVLYDKVTDAYGGYTIKTFTINEQKAEEKVTITTAELQSLQDRLAALENAKNTPIEGA